MTPQETQFEALVLLCSTDPHALAQVDDLSTADAALHRLVIDSLLRPTEILALAINSHHPAELVPELIEYYTDGESNMVCSAFLEALGETPIGVIKEHGLQRAVFPLFGFDPAKEVLPEEAATVWASENAARALQ